jgi:hypothetical protein
MQKPFYEEKLLTPRYGEKVNIKPEIKDLAEKMLSLSIVDSMLLGEYMRVFSFYFKIFSKGLVYQSQLQILGQRSCLDLEIIIHLEVLPLQILMLK